jgi:hypothetical protein
MKKVSMLLLTFILMLISACTKESPVSQEEIIPQIDKSNWEEVEQNISKVSERIALSNNFQRQGDIQNILNAVAQYRVANRGKIPLAISSVETNIGSNSGDINICKDIVPQYLASMPFDPTKKGAHFTNCDSYDTGYAIYKTGDENSISIIVTAPYAELSEIIKVTR